MKTNRQIDILVNNLMKKHQELLDAYNAILQNQIAIREHLVSIGASVDRFATDEKVFSQRLSNLAEETAAVKKQVMKTKAKPRPVCATPKVLAENEMDRLMGKIKARTATREDFESLFYLHQKYEVTKSLGDEKKVKQ